MSNKINEKIDNANIIYKTKPSNDLCIQFAVDNYIDCHNNSYRHRSTVYHKHKCVEDYRDRLIKCKKYNENISNKFDY